MLWVRENSLAFLSEIKDIENIWIWDADINDVSGIYTLRNLKSFGLSERHCGVDFSRLNHLQTATVRYNKYDIGLENTSLSNLHLWHYGKGGKLNIPKTLTELTINHASFENIKDLPSMERLQRLELHYRRNLQSIKDVRLLFPGIKHLVVLNCNKIDKSEWGKNLGINHQCINKCVTKDVA